MMNRWFVVETRIRVLPGHVTTMLIQSTNACIHGGWLASFQFSATSTFPKPMIKFPQQNIQSRVAGCFLVVQWLLEMQAVKKTPPRTTHIISKRKRRRLTSVSSGWQKETMGMGCVPLHGTWFVNWNQLVHYRISINGEFVIYTNWGSSKFARNSGVTRSPNNKTCN